ncbi:MAG TPA: hypothetical protein VF139_18335 [Candidatus Polarisedimenticolaceae bacterium]
MRTLRALLPLLLLAVAALGGGDVFAAADRVIGPDGTVHRVQSEFWPAYPGPGTAIRYTRQTPTGQLTSTLIPGTDDYWLDGEPSLTLDPLTGNPVAVWTRMLGVGFDLYISSLQGDAWTPAQPLLTPNPDRIRPRIKADGALLHVFWTHREGTSHRIARASLRAGDLVLVLGPEPARVDCVQSGDGAARATAAVEEPPGGVTYFAAEVPGRVEGEPPLLGVWGVRDEPVPIDFRVAFSLPDGARELRRVDATMIQGRLTVWFEWSGGLWYTFDDGAGNFPALRVIKREAGGFSSDAIVLVREMIDRLPAVP